MPRGTRMGAAVSRTGINTANTAYFNLNGGTGARLKIIRLSIAIQVAPSNAPVFYLSRTTARGTQASTLAGQQFDGADATGTGTLDVTGTGGSAPTFSTTNIIDIGALPVSIGGIWVWQFYDEPLIVPATANNGLAICNSIASGATTGTFLGAAIWDE